MDFDSTNLFEILFEGPEDLEPGNSLAIENSGVSLLLQDHPYGCFPNKSGNRPAGQLQCLPDDDPEDLLHLQIDPNEVYSPRSSAASPESDGGLFQEPLPPDRSPTILLEVLCDTGTLEDPNPLESWSPPRTHPPICLASQASLSFLDGVTPFNTAKIPTEQQLLHPALFLTEEERRLLRQEGVSLDDVANLSQVEERILKKIRRKIRNKQSAQDSRRRKKEYLDDLESRVATCSAQNQHLKKKVQQLEKHKESLLDQLRKLQGLLREKSNKTTQTSTCLLILLVSFGLFIWPTCASFYGTSQVRRGDPEPSGVLSRNILTQRGSSELGAPSAPHPAEQPHIRAELPLELRTSNIGKNEKSLREVGETAQGGSIRALERPPGPTEGLSTRKSHQARP